MSQHNNNVKSQIKKGMEKQVLEVVLKKSLRDSSIKRIIDMKSELAVPKGDNFISTVYKVTLKVVLGNGRIATKSFIVKQGDAGEALQASIGSGVSKMEAWIYTNVIRGMNNLMEEFGDTEGPLGCEFVHFNQADAIIILENLKALGFTTSNRSEGQDLDHARLALRGLGRFHGMAKVLEERGIISKEGYKPYIFLYEDEFIRNFIYGGIQALAKGMKASWGNEWAEAADKLSQISLEEILKRVRNCENFDEDTFRCLNHGDCWNNNMMFKRNWEGKPIEFRLIDFQIPHYNSPCVDINHFIYISIKPEVRRQNLKSLIKLYHESLTSTLVKFGYKGTIPVLENIQKRMDELSFLGKSLFVSCFPIGATKTTDALDMKELFESNGKRGVNPNIYSEDGIMEKLSEDLKEYLKLY